MTTRPVNLVRSLPTKAGHEVHREGRLSSGMNKLERRFAEWLDDNDLVDRWEFASIKLRLADRTWYTPDFFVWYDDDSESVAVYEVKGSWKAPHQDDSRVKIKVAAELYPQFRFAGVTHRKDEGWVFDWMPCRDRNKQSPGRGQPKL